MNKIHPTTIASAPRRRFLKSAAGSGLAALGGLAGAQSFDFQPNQRYPDPRVFILDPSFAKYRIYSSTVEQLGSGMRWAEGPVYFPEHGYLLLSDIPNNRLMKYDEKTGKFSVHKTNVNYTNGNTRDRQGRLMVANPGLGLVWVLNTRAEPEIVLRGVPGASLTNLAFGGPGHDVLHVTDSTHGTVLRAEPGVAGLRLDRAASPTATAAP